MSALPQARTPQRMPMTPSDLDAVLAIEQAVYPFAWTRGNFVDSLAAGHGAQVLRLSDDGTLAGYSITLAGVDELHLLNLTVAPDWQGRGLGRALLDALVAQCRAERRPTLWLEVRESNRRARAVYARYGFVEVGVRRGYYPAVGLREDAHVLRLAIDEGSCGDALD